MKYDKKSNRYRKSDGQFVARADVAKKIDSMVESTGRKLQLIGKDLTAGKINLPEFQIRMKEEIKSAHILSASIAKGGYKQMNASDWGKLGNDLKYQYDRLNNFARLIEQGRLSENQIIQRAQKYSFAARNTFVNKTTAVEKDLGRTESRRVGHSLERCVGCADWISKGWVNISDQPPIGTLQCKSFDRCTLEYR